jgi:RNA polymerase-binding transcription factor DksA
MADEGDYSSKFEIEHNAAILAAHLNRHKPKPEYNEKGEKTCLYCGVVIPKLRAEITHVVRCVPCQRMYEHEKN